MEPSGRNRWQPVANRRAPKTAQTSRLAAGMVKRGSTVRVRQRASRKCPLRTLSPACRGTVARWHARARESLFVCGCKYLSTGTRQRHAVASGSGPSEPSAASHALRAVRLSHGRFTGGAVRREHHLRQRSERVRARRSCGSVSSAMTSQRITQLPLQSAHIYKEGSCTRCVSSFAGKATARAISSLRFQRGAWTIATTTDRKNYRQVAPAG